MFDMENQNKIGQKEYIGITGFKTKEEVEAASAAFLETGITKEGQLTAMYGFLISEYQVHHPDLEGPRLPSVHNLPSLIKAVPEGMMPTLHYCSRSRELNLDTLMPLLYTVNTFSDCKFLQLNLDWPSPDKIQTIKKSIPDMYIILTVNPTTQSINDTVKKSLQYEYIVDKLLIDPSLGAGISFDTEITSKIMMKMDADSSAFSYVVCGGLDDNNAYSKIIEMKTVLKEKHPYNKTGIPFSVDAEGRLRTLNGKNLDYDKVAAYIKESARGLLEGT